MSGLIKKIIIVKDELESEIVEESLAVWEALGWKKKTGKAGQAPLSTVPAENPVVPTGGTTVAGLPAVAGGKTDPTSVGPEAKAKPASEQNSDSTASGQSS